MGPGLSIIWRELTAQPRRPRFYLKRVALVALGAVVILFGMSISRYGETTTVGLQIFASLAMSALVAMSVVALGSAASLVMREKEERTLGLLFLSDITPHGFLAAKLLTALFSSTMALLSVVPIFMLAVSLGGVSSVQILSAFALLLSTVFLLACVGLFAAVAGRTESQMNGLAGLCALAYAVLLPVGVIVYAATAKPHRFPDEVVSVLSPFAAMGHVIGGRRLWPALANSALNLALALPFLVAARALLPRCILTRDRPPLSQRVREWARGLAPGRRLARATPLRGNPVAWKDYQFWYGGRFGTWGRFALSMFGVAAILTLVFVRIGGFDEGDVFKTTVITVLIVSAGIVGLGTVRNAGQAFTREKKSRALEVLLTTSLSDEEIIRGKIVAVLRSILPWTLSLAAAGACMVALFGDDGDFWEGAGMAFCEGVGLWFGFSSLALWVSLRFRRPVAVAACVLAFLLWNTLGRTLVMLVAMERGHFSPWSFVVLDVFVYGALGGLSLAQVYARFRRTALAEFR